MTPGDVYYGRREQSLKGADDAQLGLAALMLLAPLFRRGLTRTFWQIVSPMEETPKSREEDPWPR